VIVKGLYVPNTPSLIDVDATKEMGFPVHTRTVETLRNIGKWILKEGVDFAVVITPHFARSSYIPVVSAEKLKQIYDYYGFPKPFYEYKYEPPGVGEWGGLLVKTASSQGISVRTVEDWGLDHGAWAPMSRIFPAANVPILPVGIGMDVDDAEHERLGRALTELSDGFRVVMVATGSIIHRLDLWGRKEGVFPPLALSALKRVTDAFKSGDWQRIWSVPAKEFEEAQPEGGWKPLRVLAGALGVAASCDTLVEEDEFGSVSLTTAIFTPSSKLH
jgi:4,5-DOPA dioxygenase extradiol